MREKLAQIGSKSGEIGRALIVVGVMTIAGVFALDEAMRQQKEQRHRALDEERRAHLKRLDRLFDREK